MNVLFIGAGGREHAIAWKLNQSNKIDKIYTAPGNAGTLEIGENIPIHGSDFEAIKQQVFEKNIQMVVVGPEAPLVDGIYNFFINDPELESIPVIGPSKEAAMLEGSKDFAKKFMIENNIPTAKYKTFDSSSLIEAYQFLESLKAPYVLKADGLAAGKGVLICETLEEAKKEIREMLENSKFGKASEKVVIEEFLKGIELSVFVLTDGNSYKILPSAKDYKRIGEGDTGLNTGGMGSISPVPFADKEFMEKVESRIIKPTINGLIKGKLVYKGFIFIGLMNMNGDPYVIEYNVRMGDPEAESVIPRIKSDLMDLFEGIAENNLEEKTIEIENQYCTAVFLVSGGYPGNYAKGKEISGLDKSNNSLLFHAGTSKDSNSGAIVTSGGRVLAISSFGNSIDEAIKVSYKNAEIIDFDGKYYRKDLGQDL